MNALLEAAHVYARRGWAVIPLHRVGPDGKTCSCPKGGNCGSAGKHPVQTGWTDGPAMSAADIQATWDVPRPPNVGIRTGVVSDVVVIDLDGEGGEVWMDNHADEVPETLMASTGSGGVHLFFAAPEIPMANSASKIAPGVDFRGDGGMVVVSPSVSAKGQYHWLNSRDAAPMPDWLLEAVRPRKVVSAQPASAASAPGPLSTREERYLEGALKAELARLDLMASLRTSDGTGYTGPPWNSTCYEVACNLVEIVNSGVISHDEARLAFHTRAPADDGFGHYQHGIIWSSAVSKVGAKARTVPPVNTDDPFAPGYVAPVAAAPAVAPAEPTDEELAAKRRQILTDGDLAARFAADSLRGRWCWVKEFGWMHWDGRRWGLSGEEGVIELARRYFIRYAAAESNKLWDQARLEGRGLNDDELKYMKALNARVSASALAAVSRLCRGIVEEEPEQFDTAADLLNVGNGVVDLRTGVLGPHDPALFLTKITEVNYVPRDDVHPVVAKMLQALPEEVVPWMQVRLGQAATGYPPRDDLLLVLQGGGENGKTTLLGAVQRALGEHAVLVSDRVILASDHAHPTEKMDLRGARFALIEEVPGGHDLNMNQLKKLVGTPQIKARFIAKDSVAFEATHTLFVTTNNRLIVRETDHGAWRRLAQVIFPYRFLKPGQVLEGPADRAGDQTLRSAALYDSAAQEGFLAWLVDGAKAWYSDPNAAAEQPTKVVADTLAWRKATDLILGYVDERVVFDPASHVLTKELYEDFSRWLEESGLPKWAENTFKTRFLEHTAVAAARLRSARTRSSDGLSRPPGSFVRPPLVNAATCLFGLRFRLEGERDLHLVQTDVSAGQTPFSQ